MNPYNDIQTLVIDSLMTMQNIDFLPKDLDLSLVVVEPTKDPKHGDMSTNAAMVLAKSAKKNPKIIANALVSYLNLNKNISSATVAGPGFVNLAMSEKFWYDQLQECLINDIHYGDSTIGNNEKVNVEYVSANPTGPLHVAHARGAIVGDAIANLLKKIGYDVTKEYYINDAGAQVDKLAESAYLRYKEALGHDIGKIPEGLYPGEYLKEFGEILVKANSDYWISGYKEDVIPIIKQFSIDYMIKDIKHDLKTLGISIDTFTSEVEILRKDVISDIISDFQLNGLIDYVVMPPVHVDDYGTTIDKKPLMVFKSTKYGDDLDRPLMKPDGSWTYFANDIGYHKDKLDRGFTKMVNVWGADHGGYVSRMKYAVSAISNGNAELEVILCQMVNILRDGVPVPMSKRAGTFVTLRDLMDEVGPDVVRFNMLTRSNNSHMDFDLKKVTEQSKENMVWYIQYAHTRTKSVMTQAEEANIPITNLSSAPFFKLANPAELALIKLISQWPREVHIAAMAKEPHRLSTYLYKLASEFHSYWSSEFRFITSDIDLSVARIALAKAVGIVIASGLKIYGVTPLNRMES